jgi:hypothetical protein
MSEEKAEPKIVREAKLNNNNSKLAQAAKQKESVQYNFEQQADMLIENQEARRNHSLALAMQFMSALKDKQLPQNKGIIAEDVEKEMRNKLVKLAIDINNDPNEDDDGMGSVALINLLMKAIFYQRDRINDLEYRLSKFESSAKP